MWRFELGKVLTAKQKTRKYFALTLVATLACAVILWGLQSKLSLYHSAAVRSTAPVAKLLSQKERPVSTGYVEALLVSSRHIQNASLERFPTSPAALPVILHLHELRQSDVPVSLTSSRPLRWQHLSRSSPRAPPILTS
jgi:hypothetical protein